MRGGRSAKKATGEPVLRGSCGATAETLPIVAALQVYGPLVHFIRSMPTLFHCDYKRPEDTRKALAATIVVNGSVLKLRKGTSVTQRAAAPPKVPPAMQAAAIEQAKRKPGSFTVSKPEPKSRPPTKRGEVFVASISKYTTNDELKRQLSVLGTLLTFRRKEGGHFAFATFLDMDIIYEQIDAAKEDGVEFGVYDDEDHLMPIVRSTKPPPSSSRAIRDTIAGEEEEEQPQQEEEQEPEEEQHDEPNEESDNTQTSEESEEKPSAPAPPQPHDSGSDSESSSSEAPYTKPPPQQQRIPAAVIAPPVVAVAPAIPRPGMTICHACKAPNMEGNVFCSSCGERRASPTTCFKCHTENLPGFRFCNMCGAQPPPPPPPPAVMPKGDELLRLYLAEKGASDYFAAIRDLVEKFAARK